MTPSEKASFSTDRAIILGSKDTCITQSAVKAPRSSPAFEVTMYMPYVNSLNTFFAIAGSIVGLSMICAPCRSQKSEVRNQKSEVRSQKSEVRNQKSDVRGQTGLLCDNMDNA